MAAYRIAYDNGNTVDAIPSETLAEALMRVGQAIRNGVHHTATITVVSGDAPDKLMTWSEVKRLLAV
jgi:hypothetical protein